MFGVYFGKFLLDEGVLTKSQYQDIIETNRTARLKLGPLAVNEGFMTTAQADEINSIQAMKDVRFGDIAIEKGYITQEQLETLLKKQGDSYLLFVNSLKSRNIINDEELRSYLIKFKKKNGLTAYEMDALKSSDVDRIIPIFTKALFCPVVIQDYIALVARNLVRFIDNKVRFGKIEQINHFNANYMAAQELTGDFSVYVALASEHSGNGLKKLASIYAKEEFQNVDEDVLDAACEFINVSNGLFATQLGEGDEEVDMLPPVMKNAPVTIHSSGIMYKLPFYIMEEEVTLLICLEAGWSIV